MKLKNEYSMTGLCKLLDMGIGQLGELMQMGLISESEMKYTPKRVRFTRAAVGEAIIARRLVHVFDGDYKVVRGVVGKLTRREKERAVEESGAVKIRIDVNKCVIQADFTPTPVELQQPKAEAMFILIVKMDSLVVE